MFVCSMFVCAMCVCTLCVCVVCVHSVCLRSVCVRCLCAHMSPLSSNPCVSYLNSLTVTQKKGHTTTSKMARQQRVSSTQLQRRLHFLGHILRMPGDRLPRQLLVSVSVFGKRATGGQTSRWNDVVKDLNKGRLWGLEEQAIYLDSWHIIIKHKVDLPNFKAKATEKILKDQK